MGAFSASSFFIGLIVGLLIAVIVVWILFYSRSFVFTYCASAPPICVGNDYYNDPGDALGCTNADLDEILFLNADGEMVYRRVPRNSGCTPTSDQTVVIEYPQYCSFVVPGEIKPVQAMSTGFGSNTYIIDGETAIMTSGNCTPTDSSLATSGTPVLKWNPSHNCGQ